MKLNFSAEAAKTADYVWVIFLSRSITAASHQRANENYPPPPHPPVVFEGRKSKESVRATLSAPGISVPNFTLIHQIGVKVLSLKAGMSTQGKTKGVNTSIKCLHRFLLQWRGLGGVGAICGLKRQ